MGRLEGPASGSGECSLVAGIDGAEGEWCRGSLALGVGILVAPVPHNYDTQYIQHALR